MALLCQLVSSFKRKLMMLHSIFTGERRDA